MSIQTSIVFKGDDLIKAIEAIKSSDAEMRALVLAGEGPRAGGPLLMAKVNRELFGKEAALSARIKLDQKPGFDYASEVEAAKKNYVSMMTKLGLCWNDIPEDMPLRFKSLAPGNLMRENDKPASVMYKVQLPRPALAVQGGYIFRMTAADGALLVPRPGKEQQLQWVDTSGFSIPLPDDLPADAKTLKEVLGAVYYTAGTEKKVDLGFDNIAAGAKGKALDAAIVAVTENNSTGPNQTKKTTIELTVRIPDGLQLHEIVANWPAEAKPGQSSWVRGKKNNGVVRASYTFSGTFAEKPAFVATVWENTEQFAVPFRLVDVPLTEEGFKAAKAASEPIDQQP